MSVVDEFIVMHVDLFLTCKATDFNEVKIKMGEAVQALQQAGKLVSIRYVLKPDLKEVVEEI